MGGNILQGNVQRKSGVNCPGQVPVYPCTIQVFVCCSQSGPPWLTHRHTLTHTDRQLLNGYIQ